LAPGEEEAFMRLLFICDFLERETGFEPATSTLARLHSTTELFPLICEAAQNVTTDFANVTKDFFKI
jgi:hypothetical protein